MELKFHLNPLQYIWIEMNLTTFKQDLTNGRKCQSTLEMNLTTSKQSLTNGRKGRVRPHIHRLVGCRHRYGLFTDPPHTHDPDAPIILSRRYHVHVHVLLDDPPQAICRRAQSSHLPGGFILRGLIKATVNANGPAAHTLKYIHANGPQLVSTG